MFMSGGRREGGARDDSGARGPVESALRKRELAGARDPVRWSAPRIAARARARAASRGGHADGGIRSRSGDRLVVVFAVLDLEHLAVGRHLDLDELAAGLAVHAVVERALLGLLLGAGRHEAGDRRDRGLLDELGHLVEREDLLVLVVAV